MCHLNKDGSTNFVDDSEILAVKKVILLASISNSLETELENKSSSRLRKIPKVSSSVTKPCLANYSVKLS